ncbi:MAG: ABC transporter ATP-binding protein, partial [Deltaproteobacteria bacterium]
FQISDNPLVSAFVKTTMGPVYISEDEESRIS